MGHSRVVCVWTFVWCLVVFVPENAIGELSQEAKNAMEKTKNAIKQVCEKAESYVGNATIVSQRVETFKRKAEEAKSQATKAESEAEKTAEGYEKAEAVVKDIKSLSNTVSTLCSKATGELQAGISSTSELIAEAKNLKSECGTEIELIQKSENTYTGKEQKASDLKNKADALDKKITSAIELLDKVDSEETMKNNAEEAQVKNFHVSVIVAVAKIETMMGDANGIIQTIKTKKNNVNEILKEMQALKATTPSGSIDSIDEMCKSAEDELRKATGAFDKSQKAELDMKQEKDIADAALKTFETAKEVEKAQGEVTKADACVEKLKGIVLELKSERQITLTCVANANALKQKLVTILSTTTSAPTRDEVKETEKSDISLRERTRTNKKDATQQPAIISTEKPTRKDALDQGDNTADKLKDTLINGAQNVPTTALTGKKAPAPGANNDSAMTVSVPLLVALIASAVLQ